MSDRPCPLGGYAPKITFLDTVLSLGCALSKTPSVENIWMHILLCDVMFLLVILIFFSLSSSLDQ
jgi:hypothetical protein